MARKSNILILTLRAVADNSPVPLAALAGSIAAAAYLDAKYLIRNDLAVGSVGGNAAAALAFITERAKQDRLLVYRELTCSTPIKTFPRSNFQ
jgi:hypothetical protein